MTAEALGCARLDIGGRKYYFLGQRPARLPRTPDCIFLAGFDPMLLGYQKTENPILPPEHLRQVFNMTGIVFPTILLAGRVAARWKEEPRAIRVTPFRPLTGRETEALGREADRLWPGKPVKMG